MSDHDPFDGVYTRSMIAEDKPEPKAETESSDTLYDSASVHAEPEAEVEQNVQSADDTDYSLPFLRRQSKAELQDICKAKGLDASGGREDMIERITEAQK